MAHIVADRVLETTTTTGVGALTLAGAVAGYRTFASVCANADTAHYYIEAVDTVGRPTGAWETGTGTWGTGNLFTRTTVRASSNAGAAVSFAAGTKRVAISITAYAHTSLIATGSTGLFADGTAAAPSISFASDPDTGIFHSAANAVGIATGGVESMVVDAAGDVNVRRHLAVGTLGVPSNVVSIVASDNYSANGTRYGIQNNVTTDNTAALTADRLCYGAINQVVSTLQGAAAFTQTVRGAYNLAVIGPTGGYSVDGEGSLTGSYNLAQNQSTDATFNRCESLIGSYNFASLSGATALGDSVYGTYSLAQASGAGSTITQAWGVSTRVQTTIAGAAIGTGYLFYGDFVATGTITTRYGVYIPSTVNNFFAGGIQIGGTALAGTSAAGLGVGVGPPGVAGTILASGSITSQTQHLGLATDTAAAPSFSWTGDTNMGMFRVGTDILGLTTAGAERMRIDAAGNVGVNTTSPSVAGTSRALVVNGVGGATVMQLRISDVAASTWYADAAQAALTAAGARYLSFETNAAERMRIDAAGNVGVGVAPSAWGAGHRTVQVQGLGLMGSVGGLYSYIVTNMYYDGSTWRRYAAGAGTVCSSADGEFDWRTVATGAAGSAVTPTVLMRLDAAGSLSIGQFTGAIPDRVLISRNSVSSADYMLFNNRGTNATHTDVYEVGGVYGAGYRDVLSTAAYIAGIAFERAPAVAGLASAGSIVFRASDVGAATKAGVAERMRLDGATGNLTIGTTTISRSHFATGDIALNTVASPGGAGGGLVIIRGYNGNTGGGFSRLYAYWGQTAGGLVGAGMTLVGSAGDTSPAFVMAQAGGFLRITASGTLGGQWVVSYFAM